MKKSLALPSIALVYDRVNTPHGGAENVLLALHQAFPQAPLYTSLYAHQQAVWAQQFSKVHASFLNRFPFFNLFHRWLAWLMPLAFESLDLSGYDIVISITSAEAKGVLTWPDQLHICYLLTPPRYLYHSAQHSLDSNWFLRLPIIHQVAQLALNYLKWWDQAAIFRPDAIIPISQRVAKRASQFYPEVVLQPVIYPPITLPTQATDTQLLNGVPKNYFLVVSRLVSHKHLDTALQTCLQLNKNLVIVGTGPEKGRLTRLAQRQQTANQILFFDSVSLAELASLYAHCQAVLMPGEEDFGIVALEANAYGKPVIINTNSGAAELIKPGVDGLHLTDSTVESLKLALQKFEKTSFIASKIRQNPVQYGTHAFVRHFSETVAKAWKTHQEKQ